ncbi:MAG TPA: HepT-like ribonuclease domain-containing protein [Candidatus Dormibacteraeota bacterium]|nr:HepT-like ribonuclease domain-containing protein [Candidatus Dormibacteraeota bacterium]
MTKHEDSFYLEGIQEHIAAIKQYLPNSKAKYLADEMLQDALLMRLLAIGEEITHLSDSVLGKYPELEWPKIIGLRNRIVHGYFEVDKDVIWQVLTDGSLNELSAVIENQLGG